MIEEKGSLEAAVREIRRKTRKKHNAEEKMRVVLEGLRGGTTIAELCRREGLHPNLNSYRGQVSLRPRSR